MAKFTPIAPAAFQPASTRAGTGTTEYNEDILALTRESIVFLPVPDAKEARGTSLTLHRAAHRLDRALHIAQGTVGGQFGLSIRLATAAEAAAMDDRRTKAEARNAEKKAAGTSVAAPAAIKNGKSKAA